MPIDHDQQELRRLRERCRLLANLVDLYHRQLAADQDRIAELEHRLREHADGEPFPTEVT